MALITSISGIRGTIGGKPGISLTPIDIIKFTTSYGNWIKQSQPILKKYAIVIGRDARPSGEPIQQMVSSTLQLMGIDIIDIGLTTTPTLAMAIMQHQTQGGIMISASHNPIEWNALKLFNNKGEHLTSNEAEHVLNDFDFDQVTFASNTHIGKYHYIDQAIDEHINKIISLDLVDTKAIQAKNYSIAIDGINSTGAIVIPKLLQALGIEKVININAEPNGYFQHNPEPLSENLDQLSQAVIQHKCNLGFAVDPDVDRLAIVDEKGVPYGEEYTLPMVASYVLQYKKGDLVTNLSSSQITEEIALKQKVSFYATPVGEAHVIAEMKKTKAVIGGEGNGGIIYPDLHYGRDALVGIALFLSYLAQKTVTAAELRSSYTDYYLLKGKITLHESTSLDQIFNTLTQGYKYNNFDTRDGLKIIFPNKRWVHLRKSNTEPIIRIYIEAPSKNEAQQLMTECLKSIQSINQKKT